LPKKASRFTLALLCSLFALYTLGFLGDRYLLTVLTFGSIFAVYAMTLNFIAAYVGQVNFGHAIFFGIGGYVTAYLTKTMNLPITLTLLSSVIISLFAGFILGFLTLRTKGPFLILITALSNIVLIQLVYAFSEFTGGEDGLTGVPRITADPSLNYYIFLTYALSTTFILTSLIHSKLGYGFKLIKEDDELAEAMGVNVVAYKLLAFTISSTLTGLAGALYAHYSGVVGPGTLSFELTFQALVMILLGGWGTIPGPLIGAYVVTLFNEYLRILGLYRTLILGVSTLAVLLKFRKGVYGLLQDRIRIMLGKGI
jgi:branched-chain amino acid transport system permease protein